MNKKAVCLIVYDPFKKLIFIEFLNTFTNYDVYVVIDNNNNYSDLSIKYKNIKFIQINNNLCILTGYKNLSYIPFKKSC